MPDGQLKSTPETLAYQKEYRQGHKKEYNKWKKEYRRNDRTKTSSYKIRQEVIAKLGGKCARCGFEDWRALQVDHIDGGGKKEYEAFKGWWGFYKHVRDLKDWQGKYQLLCANCNWIKRYEDGECRDSRNPRNSKVQVVN